VSFYLRVAEDRFEATEHTRGPWDERSQHAGPPAALLGRVIEQRPAGRPDMRVARLTYDIHRPVPVGPLTVAVRTVRSGRSVEIVEAELRPDGDAPAVMHATALLIRTAAAAAPPVLDPAGPPAPEAAAVRSFFPVGYETGYHTAMEVRFAEGEFLSPGPATAWFRMRVALVDGEEPSPLTRVLVAADSGNGISNVLDFRRHLFVNADLTVHLLRYPVGEWVCLDARTLIDDAGIGLTDSALFDEAGQIGRAAQSLFVAARAEPSG
jgi:hypothetical protein